MLMMAIPKFIRPTGKAPSKNPYNENKLDPIKLIHLSLIIELINKEISTIREAKYPNHSNQLISITLKAPFKNHDISMYRRNLKESRQQIDMPIVNVYSFFLFMCR